MVGHSNNLNCLVFHAKHQIKRKSREHYASRVSNTDGPRLRRVTRKGHHAAQFLNKRMRGDLTALGVSRERLIDLFFSCFMENYFSSHSIR